jgi:hypothetical protein
MRWENEREPRGSERISLTRKEFDVPKFMLILHHKPNTNTKLSPAEMQQVMGKYQAWFDKIRASGKYVSSDKLMDEGGKVMTMQNGRIGVIDGPYSEAKEVVGGYLVVRAENYDEAIEMFRDCPHLAFGGRLEVRKTDAMGCGGE